MNSLGFPGWRKQVVDYRKFEVDFPLGGKTVAVTGGAQGIGRAICEAFARNQANVVILDIADAEGEKTMDLISGNQNVSAAYFHTDLTSKTNIEASIAEAEKSGPIDILVNNAAIGPLGNAESLSVEDWDNTLALNAKGVFLTSQVLAGRMIPRGYGKIVNIASKAGIIALDRHVAYAASKAAVIMMTKVMAYEWARYGINVNAVSPTVVLTELGKKAWGGAEGEAIKALIPNGRFAEPDEVAAAVLYLASDAAAMINGENLIIDGGYSIH
jgi:glycerol dehydrogenase